VPAQKKLKANPDGAFRIKELSVNDSALCSATSRRTRAGLIAAPVKRCCSESISSSVKPMPFLRNPAST